MACCMAETRDLVDKPELNNKTPDVLQNENGRSKSGNALPKQRCQSSVQDEVAVTAANRHTSSDDCTEYKCGKTTYVVTAHFSGEPFERVVERIAVRTLTSEEGNDKAKHDVVSWKKGQNHETA